MAINGDDFYHPQSPSTPVGEEGATKREALVFFLAMGFAADLGEAALHSSVSPALTVETSNKLWDFANLIMAADPTP